MCSSIVRYARPQKARSASGEWKYIVNTGEHTQTLRLEKCSNPQESCSYLSENYRSRCIQVYNYHRLLSWDKTRGLHVDIFKVPTCCSCHVDGYREAFPPLSATSNSGLNKYKEFTPSVLRSNHYSTIIDDEEDEDEDEEANESIAFQFSNGFKRVKSPKFDPISLHDSSSSLGIKTRYDNTKTKSPSFSSNIGSFLNPPANNFHAKYSFKRGPNITPNSGNFLSSVIRKRQPSNLYDVDSDDRLDQTISNTDIAKEVTVYPPIDSTTVHAKRKRISSVSTATSRSRPVPTTTRTPSTTTIDTRTLLNTKLTNTKTDSTKRVNYNYHPIIDFFEEQSISSLSSPSLSSSPSSKKGKRGGGSTLTDRRIGLNGQDDDENWRPMIME